MHGNTCFDDMGFNVDDLPVVWLVVIVDDPLSINDARPRITGLGVATMNSIEFMIFVES